MKKLTKLSKISPSSKASAKNTGIHRQNNGASM